MNLFSLCYFQVSSKHFSQFVPAIWPAVANIWIYIYINLRRIKNLSFFFQGRGCLYPTTGRDGRVRLFFISFVHRLWNTYLFSFSKMMDFVYFQNYHSFFIYFVCFLSEWSLGKSHKFHKKGIIHLAYSSVLLHIFCICTVLLLWLVEIRPDTWSELECTVKIICFILMFVNKFFFFKIFVLYKINMFLKGLFYKNCYFFLICSNDFNAFVFV